MSHRWDGKGGGLRLRLIRRPCYGLKEAAVKPPLSFFLCLLQRCIAFNPRSPARRPMPLPYGGRP
jgi:hypothetical protein